VSYSSRVRYQRLLREAEGYLELGLPKLAIEALGKMQEPGTFRSRQLHLLGEAFRAQGRFNEAIDALEASVDKTPSKIDIYLALGWCYKRTGRLDLAIEALQKALEIDPEMAILHYNMACYLSLDRQKERALACLGEALRRDGDYREMIAGESDFDPLRHEPEFQALVGVTV
jgi:tetratricopeptide (TPR) repeat protein